MRTTPPLCVYSLSLANQYLFFTTDASGSRRVALNIDASLSPDRTGYLSNATYVPISQDLYLYIRLNCRLPMFLRIHLRYRNFLRTPSLMNTPL